MVSERRVIELRGCALARVVIDPVARVIAPVAIALLSGCGEPPPTTRNDAGPPPPTPAAVQNIAAYEGQGAFVSVLESSGDDWTSATVTATSGLEILSQRCGASLCAVVARVPDSARNTGQSIPAPIDAIRHFLTVTRGTMQWQGLVQVFPTDALTAPGGETMVNGTYFAASVDAAAGSVLRGVGSEPVRWVVFGDATIDTFDVSASAEAPGPGGHAGGAAGADGAGAGGGAAADGAIGAGGGASAEPGGLGVMATEASTATDPRCATDFFAVECGGSGGGGDTSEGGAGAGSVAIVVLGSACVQTVRGVGGDATAGGGGGGGGGGIALVAASRFGCDPSAVMDGGGADGEAGAGGAGRLLIGGTDLPRISFEASSLITSEPSYMLAGSAAPDHVIRIERITDAGAELVVEAMSGADGSFAIPTDLTPGLNRIRLTQVADDGSTTMRAFNGNHVELERRDGFVRQLPVGGLLDVAYVP